MNSRILFTVLCVLAIVRASDESKSEKYTTACPGSFNDTGSHFRKFYEENLLGDNGLMNKCNITYFKTIPKSCDDEQKECAKAVQQFMWDRCHWRLLYDVANDLKSVTTAIREQNIDIYDYIMAMAKNDAIYDFASKCANWDWIGILIMVCCAFFGAYIILIVVGGIMKLTMKKPKKEEEKTE